MKNKEIIKISDVLSSYTTQLKELQGAKFTYGLIKNMERLDKAVREIIAKRIVDPEFEAYDKLRIAVCEKFADRDDTGQPKKKYYDRNNYDYVIETSRPEFDNAMESLKKEHAELLERQDANQKAFNVFLDEECKLEFHKIDLEHVPNDITLELMSVIKLFIND